MLRHSFVRRAADAIAGQAGQALGALLLTLAVARVAPPSVRGEYVLLILLAQLGTYLVSLGLPAAILASVAADGRSRARMASLALVGSVVTGLTLTAVGLPLLTLAGVTRPHIALLLVGNASVAWLIFAMWLNFGEQRYLRAGLTRTVPLLLAAMAVPIVAAVRDPTPDVLYAAWVVPNGATALFVLRTVARDSGFGPLGMGEVRERLAYGLRFSVGQMAQLGAMRADQWILAAIASTYAVGVYSIAAAASEAIMVAATALGVLVFTDSASGSSSLAFRRQLVAAVVAVTAAGVALAIVAPQLITGLFGGDYAAAVTPLRIMLAGTPGLVVARMTTNRLAGLGAPGLASSSSVLALVVTLGLDLALIPSFEMNGAAVASAIGYTVGGALGLIALRHRDRRQTSVAGSVEVGLAG